MGIDKIQIGLDIATSISIGAAAVAFIINNIRERRKAELFKEETLRREHMQHAIGKLTNQLENCYVMDERIKWAPVLNENIPKKDILDSSFAIINTCKILKGSAFITWATEVEKKSISELVQFSSDWMNAFSRGQKGEVQPYEDLIDKVSETIIFLSEELRSNTYK